MKPLLGFLDTPSAVEHSYSPTWEGPSPSVSVNTLDPQTVEEGFPQNPGLGDLLLALYTINCKSVHWIQIELW